MSHVGRQPHGSLGGRGGGGRFSLQEQAHAVRVIWIAAVKGIAMPQLKLPAQEAGGSSR